MTWLLFVLFQHLKPKMKNRYGTHVVKKSIFKQIKHVFFFILIYIHEYAYNQIINVRCKLYNKHFEKMLALLGVIYKHNK